MDPEEFFDLTACVSGKAAFMALSTRSSGCRPLVLIPQPFGSLVFERRTCRYLPFDAEATGLLLDLAGVGIDALVARTKEGFRRELVARFYEEFYEQGFFTVDGRLAGEILDVAPPADHLTGPLAVHLSISDTCNLGCLHCFAGEFSRQGTPLSLAELDRLFGQMARMGSYRLGLTGGEPLLRGDLFEIIDLALANGLSPCVTTNGLLLDEPAARKFGGRDLLWLNVSLEGACPATNDLVRGRGSFAQVMNNLRVLARHARFSLAFTVMRTNLHEIGKCAELALGVGAESAVFRPLYPVGAARQHLDLMPTFEEYNSALEALDNPGLRGITQNCELNPFSPTIRQPASSVIYWNHGCGAGNSVCSISQSGEVNPCSFLGPEFEVGNVRDRSLSDLWRDVALERFRKPAANAAPALTFNQGCRARSLWLKGSVDAPDPWIVERGAISPGATS
jgi:radical SAM protein with 4Fe4S-binding SPASM domain